MRIKPFYFWELRKTLPNTTTICISAPPQFGKTTIARAILYNMLEMQMVTPERVLIFKNSDEEERNGGGYAGYQILQLSEILLESIMRRARETVFETRGMQPKWLVIFDDVSKNVSFFNKSPAFANLIFNHRHLNIHIIFSTHVFKILTPDIRSSIEYWFFPTINDQHVIDYIKQKDLSFDGAKRDALINLSTDILNRVYNCLVFIKITVGDDRWRLLQLRSPKEKHCADYRE